MIVKEALSRIEKIILPDCQRPVYQTVAQEMQTRLSRTCTIKTGGADGFRLLIDADSEDHPSGGPKHVDWFYLRLEPNGTGELRVSAPHLLFSCCCQLFDWLAQRSLDDYRNGRFGEIAFRWNRPVFDCVLTQLDRTARKFDYRSHIREYARLGFSHVEVNALATPHGLEPRVPHEVLPVFYTYCAGMDQFVSSRLFKGAYPEEYLSANLNLMKTYAAEAIRYGMTPGMLSFEPRNAPDSVLQKYPMLRGARVDHPFRSLKPRFTLALAHPFVRMHYRELMQNLLREIPELGYIAITTNDSGAGFEYTRSLYAGANGGPYLIREWKSVEEVAKAAAHNAIRFFQLLRDSASEINPDFRVMIRLEPFSTERDHLLKEIGDRIDVEGASFKPVGYGAAYMHEMYDDVAVNGTAWQTKVDSSEREFLNFLEKCGSHGHLFYSCGLHINFDPLLGIPYPFMLHEKLQSLRDLGADTIAASGGIQPPSLAPWCINREIVSLFQHQPDLPVEDALDSVAQKWVGPDLSADLLQIWKLLDKGLRAFPGLGLYSMTGMDWYRLWIRPLVPDIEKIPEKDREYYERFLLSTTHNPNRVDLDRDVLFELVGCEQAKKLAERMEKKVLPVIQETREFIHQIIAKCKDDAKTRPFFIDLADRIEALVYWLITLRNVQIWITNVHGYLQTDDMETKKTCRENLRKMVLSEIENSQQLLDFWHRTETEFMVVSGSGESVHQLGENFGEHLAKKIALMQGHEDDEPYIDPHFMWRVPDLTCYKLEEALRV